MKDLLFPFPRIKQTLELQTKSLLQHLAIFVTLIEPKYCLRIILVAFFFCILTGFGSSIAEDVSESRKHVATFREDFESGIDRWEIIDPKTWELQSHGKGQSLAITSRQSEYEPKVRSPKHIALIRDLEAEGFEMTFAVKSTKDTGNHRDCCVFFNYQDPTHFYYIHLGAKPDPHSGQIFIVNDAPRLALTQNDKRVPWGDDWHQVKLVRDFGSGSITIYFDDMETPQLKVIDKTFGMGRIGIGSFDDMDAFDEIEVRVR